MSQLSQSSISEVDFLHLDQYFSLTKSLKTVGEAFRSPLKVLEFYSYLPVQTLVTVTLTSDLISRIIVPRAYLSYFI